MLSGGLRAQVRACGIDGLPHGVLDGLDEVVVLAGGDAVVSGGLAHGDGDGGGRGAQVRHIRQQRSAGRGDVDLAGHGVGRGQEQPVGDVLGPRLGAW